MAAAMAVAAPAAHALPAAGLNPTGSQLLLYDTAAPGTVLERHDITGLQPSEKLVGIDVRPATGQLYGVGIVRTAFDEGRTYVIDPGTGAATMVGPSPFKSGMQIAEYGIDFSPVADILRVVSGAELNLRVNPNDGSLIQQDSNLAPASNIDAIAYDQNVAGTTQTTLWGYDSGTFKVVRIGGVDGGPPENSPNTGAVAQPFGSSGISPVGRAEMDFAPDGKAFLTAQPDGATSTLYSLNMSNGAATSVGNFPEPIQDLAVMQGSSFAIASGFATEDAGNASVAVTRSGNLSGTQTVSYATADGSAGASDYTPSSGTVTFGPGEANKTIAVPITGDSDDEPAETLSVALSAPTGGAIVGGGAGTLTIIDDDSPPAVVVPDTTRPQLLLSVPSAMKSRTLLKGLKGSFSCSEGCVTKFTLKLGKTALGSTSKSLAAAGRGNFTVKLSAKGKKALRKALKKKRSVAVSLTASGKDAAGNTGTAPKASVKVSR
jgi:hypothetical protein